MTVPTDYAAFRQALEAHRASLPKRLRQCAAYFDAFPERVAFDTVAQVAAAAEVQPSAVVRFAKVLGFSGYSELQNLFRAQYAERWPDYPTRLARMRGHGGAHDLLQKFASAGARSMARMAGDISPEVIETAVKSLSAATTIHIAGFRRSFPVATYLAYAFEQQGRACRLIDGTGLLNTATGFAEGDRLLAISFAPYTQLTVDLVAQARGTGAEVIAISDAVDSPVFANADLCLEVHEEDVSDFRMLTATFALATALVVSAGAESA